MKNKGIRLLFSIIIFATTLLNPFKVHAEPQYVKVGTFIEQLVQAMKLDVDSSAPEPYFDAALKAGILKEDTFSNYNEFITRTEAAILLNKADDYLYEDKLDEKLYKMVLEKRISDINKIPKDKRKDVAEIVAKGIIKGSSNGKYIQNRSFKGEEYFTKSEAKITLIRLMNQAKRAKLSPDGQLIRTTNLPKNADKFEYILECFPNSFYEIKFDYQRAKYYYKPKEIIDYASPVRVYDRMKDQPHRFDDNGRMIYLYEWTGKAELNLTKRLNVDYRTIDKDDTWLNDLRSTYYIYNIVRSDKRMTDDIKEYIKFVKKNKVVIEGEIIALEPSTLYYSTGYYIRVYTKFKVKSPKFNAIKDDIIYGGYLSDIKPLEEDKWMECVFEIGVGSKNGYSQGDDYAVDSDSIIVFAD